MRHVLRLFRRSNRGTSAIEFALIVPVLLAFMAGVVEMGRAFQVYNTVNRLATRYAIAWADCPGTIATCGAEASSYMTPAAVQNMAPQLNYTASNPIVRMLLVQVKGTPTVQWPTSATLSPAESTIATAVIGSGNTGVVVTVTYTHTLVFFAQVMSQILGGATRTVSYTVAQRKT